MRPGEKNLLYISSGLSALTSALTVGQTAHAQDVPQVNVNVEIEPVKCINGCCPPTLGQKAFIGAGSLALLVILLFLFVKIIQLHYIKTGRNPQVGQHAGISLSLFLGSLGMAAIVLLVTKCWPPEFWIWVAFAGGVWLLHAIYTMVVSRS